MKLTDLRPDVVIEGKKGVNPFADKDEDKKDEDKKDEKSENPFAKKGDKKGDDDGDSDDDGINDKAEIGGFKPGKKGVDPFPDKKGGK